MPEPTQVVDPATPPATAAPAVPAPAAATPVGLAAGKAPAADPAAAASAASKAMTGIDESWRNALPEELRNDPSIKITKTVEDLAKGYVHSQKMIGADKIVVPGKNTTPEEWRAIKTKLGLPEAADKYGLKVPEGVPAEAPFLKKFTEAAHKAGVLPGEAQELLNWYHQESVAEQKAAIDAHNSKVTEGINGLKKEYGQAYDAKVASACQGLEAILGKETADKLIDDPVLGAHPGFIRLAVKLADLLAEDVEVGADGKPVGALAPAQAQARIDSLMKEQSYLDGQHPKHAEAMAEMKRLFEMLHPDPIQ